MYTPIAIQAIYTIVLALSAGIVTFAACIAARQLAPIFPWLSDTPEQTHSVPYATIMATVMLGFCFTAYVTPATIVAATALLIVHGIGNRRSWTQDRWSLSVLVAISAAILTEYDMSAETLPSPQEWGIIIGCMIATVLFSLSGTVENSSPLKILIGLASAAVVAVPIITGSFTHGTAGAAIVTASGAALLMASRKGGVLTVPASVIVAMAMILVHGAVRLAQDHMLIPAAGITAMLLLSGAIVAAASLKNNGVR
jgi:hypothetical protein